MALKALLVATIIVILAAYTQAVPLVTMIPTAADRDHADRLTPGYANPGDQRNGYSDADTSGPHRNRHLGRSGGPGYN